jgi:carbon storage regulator
MYILSRKIGESIFIGEEVEVKVASIKSNRVRLAITGPSHVRIMRAELLKARSDLVPTSVRRSAS